jgi:hypothetical protein
MYPGPTPPGQKAPISIGNGLHWNGFDQFTLLEAACLWAGGAQGRTTLSQ